MVRAVGTGYIVRVQNPIILDDASEPQPDITVLGYKNDFYKDALPTARDVAMIVEVSDTSSEFDRIVKLPRYASSGIPEFWLIDLVKDHVEVHTNPTEDTYGSTSIYQRGERAVSETIPAIDLLVDEILG